MNDYREQAELYSGVVAGKGEDPGVYKKVADDIAKWLHEQEDRRIIENLNRLHKDALDRLHRLIHDVIKQGLDEAPVERA